MSESFEITKERRRTNVDWPSWLHRAWNLDRGSVGGVWDESGGSDNRLVVGTCDGNMVVNWGDSITYLEGVIGLSIRQPKVT